MWNMFEPEFPVNYKSLELPHFTLYLVNKITVCFQFNNKKYLIILVYDICYDFALLLFQISSFIEHEHEHKYQFDI